MNTQAENIVKDLKQDFSEIQNKERLMAESVIQALVSRP